MNRIVAILIMSLPLVGRAQLVVSNFTSTMVNPNFIIENHEQPDRNFIGCVYLVQFDSLMPRLELHFSSRRDLDYFNNYLLCFVTECHRDRQPLLLPGFPKLIYSKELRGYSFEDSKTRLFKRSSFLEFAKAIRKNSKKGTFRVRTGWQRLKIFY